MTPKSFWPDDTQALLLGACLLRDSAAALDSWRRWKSRVDLADLDHASFQIMSFALHRLLELGFSDPDLLRIKGLHRYQWTQSQLAARGNRELLTAMHIENIPTLLLGGASLAQTVYPEPNTRPLHDSTILIPVESASHAIELLKIRGWMTEPFIPPRTIKTSRACTLKHPDHGTSNLRWRLMNSDNQPQSDDEFWNAARPFEFDQMPTRILCPVDQFLLACEHGLREPTAAGLIWLLDCVLILRNSASPFDWPRLVRQSKNFQLLLHTRETLSYLYQHFESSMPSMITTELAQIPVTLDQRMEVFLAVHVTNRQSFNYKLGMAACHYLRMKRGGILRQLRLDIPRFLRWLRAPIDRRVKQQSQG